MGQTFTCDERSKPSCSIKYLNINSIPSFELHHLLQIFIWLLTPLDIYKTKIYYRVLKSIRYKYNFTSVSGKYNICNWGEIKLCEEKA